MNTEPQPISPSPDDPELAHQLEALAAENQALKQKFLTDQLAEEVKEKVSVWAGDAFKITISLTALMGVVIIALAYGVIQHQARQTAALKAQKIAKEETQALVKQIILEDVRGEAVNEVRQQLTQEKSWIVKKIAENVKQELRQDPELLARMYDISRDAAKNSKKLDKEGFFVIAGSATSKESLAFEQKLAEQAKLKTLICSAPSGGRFVLL
ncbi:MAG: hypothetical protein ACKO5Q_01225, partial [Microcystaceae cyanobacterium]